MKPMTDAELNHEKLKKLDRELRSNFDEHLAVRVHRCISWIQRAEAEMDNEDHDAAFIFYWIAFNAIYSAERFYRSPLTERDIFIDFFRTIIELDKERSVYDAIFTRFSDSIRTLLKNKFVFHAFWESVNSKNQHWETQFDRANREILNALTRMDTVKVLSRLFDRLYVLRNQLMHGGATWNGSVNRSQVSDGARILQFLVPIMVCIMMRHPKMPWSKPFYPVIER